MLLALTTLRYVCARLLGRIISLKQSQSLLLDVLFHDRQHDRSIEDDFLASGSHQPNFQISNNF